MGYFQAYDKDNQEVTFKKTGENISNENYYSYLIEKSLELEDNIKSKDIRDAELSTGIFDFNKDQIKYAIYLLTFWGEETKNKYLAYNEDIKKYKENSEEFSENLLERLRNLDNIKVYKVDNDSDVLDNVIGKIADYELLYNWKYNDGSNIVENYKIVSSFNIYNKFFKEFDTGANLQEVNYDKIGSSDNVTRNNSVTMFIWNIDKSQYKRENKDNYSPDIFPPFFAFEDEEKIYFLVNENAPLLFFNTINETKGKEKKLFNYYYLKQENNIDICKIYQSTLKIDFTKSSGGYLGRPDSMDEVDYRWSINNLDENEQSIAELLAFLIGLSFDKRINKILDDKKTYSEGDKTFYKTNTPASYNNVKNNVENLKVFFDFYKCFKKDTNKRNYPKNNIRIPLVFDGKSEKSEDSIYTIDRQKILYKYKNKGKNISTAKKLRRSQAEVMANSLKDFSFFKKVQPTYTIASDKKPNKAELKNSNYSATSFAQYVLYYDAEANKSWKKLYFEDKNTFDNKEKEVVLELNNNVAKVDTEQEWCHLLGHADGGEDAFGNLVSGSRHCNTEQLAMEIGQSRFLKKYPALNIETRITASLIRSNPIFENKSFTKEKIRKELGLDNNASDDKINKEIIDFLFKEDKDGYKLNIENEKLNLNTTIEEELDEPVKNKHIALLAKVRRNLSSNFIDTLPLAENMRYKHYINDQKVFDHVYDAQSESICSLECKILDYTLEANLYVPEEITREKNLTDEQFFLLKWEKYVSKLIERVEKKLPTGDALEKSKNEIKKSQDKKVLQKNKGRKKSDDENGGRQDLSEYEIKVDKKVQKEVAALDSEENKMEEEKTQEDKIYINIQEKIKTLLEKIKSKDNNMEEENTSDKKKIAKDNFDAE